MTGALPLLLLVAAAFWTPAGAGAAPDVRYAHGRLTADVQDVALGDLLGAMASKAGFEVRGTPTPRTVTLRLEAVPVPDAVSRLLEGQRVAYTYDRHGGLKRVEFFEVGADVPPAAVPGAHPAVPAAEDRPTDVPARDRPVPIDGLLASALGGSQSSFSQIVGVALQAGDARLRKQALRAALALLDADPDLRADVAASLEAIGDDALAERLREVAGAHAEEIAFRTARLSHWQPLRRRAGAVLRLIRAGG